MIIVFHVRHSTKASVHHSMIVEQLMTRDVITISPSTPIQEAEKIMQEKNIRRLLVVENSKPVGIIVYRDMIGALNSPTILKETPIEWVMTRKLITTSPDTSVAEAIQTLRRHKINALPVIDGDKLVGIITVVDLLHELTRRLENDPN
ncbi:CBS domain-containing protein [Aneurinibacillus uraniidurans]|uniref:CBS domain-containing protein n=1 Tax=Aneurinibacillus uraniidurans TaxID=2966586 RepID=UPI00234A8EF0|nr:CBS domain-containing protein [Aneurinibacillus sp. B1]WCN39375.1 CBS domain-containing protein [Aneurinibacillus sp. B1]